jgi:DNA adenine methylase
MSADLLGMLQAMSDSHDVREHFVRAPFPWPGAKSRSVKHILPHLPYRSGYGEAFGGSAAVLLSRNGSPLEVFNDRFSGVTTFYRVIRDGRKMNALLDRLQLCLHSREEFVWSKATWKDCEDEVERAARWYYMVMTSFAAQARHFGRCTGGKAQMGPKLKNNLKLFPEVHKRLLHVQIENQDWRAMLKDYDKPDFVWYLDPPYYEYCKGMYECEMTKDEHVELLERIFHLDGFVALSGYENPMYDRYSWDHRYEWTVQVSSLGQGFTETNNLAGFEGQLQRGTAKEVLWLKESRG